MATRRFLISRLSSLGDVVCTLPVAAFLKVSWPDSEIVWAVDKRFKGIVECCTAVDQVQLPDEPLEGEFDAAFDMQGLLKSARIVGQAKAKTKLGYHWQREGARLFSSPVLPDPTSFHIVDQYLDVVRAYAQIEGVETERSTSFDLQPKTDDLEKIRLLLKQNGIDRPFVLMNVGAGWASKRWPATSFSQLIDHIHKNGTPCVLLGGNAESDHTAAHEVMEKCEKKPVSLLGQTNVRELVALVSFCSVHVGGDTGSTHLAAALGRPAVGLYSITRPQRSCPYGQIERCHYDPDGLSKIEFEAVASSIAMSVKSTPSTLA